MFLFETNLLISSKNPVVFNESIYESIYGEDVVTGPAGEDGTGPEVVAESGVGHLPASCEGIPEVTIRARRKPSDERVNVRVDVRVRVRVQRKPSDEKVLKEQNPDQK